MDSEIALKIEVIQRIGASLHTEDTSAIYFLRRVFGHQVEEVKDAVAEALVALWHPEFKQALRDVAVFVEERERHSEEMSAPPCASFFLQALGNSETYIWRCVDCALAKIGSPVVPDLLKALMHGEDNVRRGAASALGRIGDPVAIPALVSLLRDRKVWVQDCAVHALTRYGSPAVPAVIEELRDERSRLAAVKALGGIGDASAAPALLQAMQTANPERTWEYWKAFQKIGQGARPVLLEALQDPYEFRRASAVEALSAIALETDVPLFLEALRDTGTFGRVRDKAADALGLLKDASAVPALREACRDRHAAVRERALSALGTCGGMEILPDVIERLGDPNFRVQQIASMIFVSRGSASIPLLEQALVHSTENVRITAASTLQEIQEDGDLPLRILRLPDVEPAEKAAALKALEKAHHPLPTAVTFCRDLATNSDPELRQAAESVLSCLEKEITAPKPPSTRRFFGWKLKR